MSRVGVVVDVVVVAGDEVQMAVIAAGVVILG